MTSMIPDSVISKIMLFISHPIADLVKTSLKFKERRKRIDSLNHTQIWNICFDCGENTDWIHKDLYCDKCRVDECEYCGRDLKDPDYNPDFWCRHCS